MTSAVEFVAHYEILDSTIKPEIDYALSTKIDNHRLSQKLFSILVTGYFLDTENSRDVVYEYRERVVSMVQVLRATDVCFIDQVLRYIMTQNPYLTDVVILLWCLPHNHLSRKRYDACYRELVTTYLGKLCHLVETEPLRNFALEMISRDCRIPPHCIDVIWPHMRNLNFDVIFISRLVTTIYIRYPECEKFNYETDYIEIGLNMVYLLDLGLGKTGICDVIRKIVTDTDLSKPNLSENFCQQVAIIKANWTQYFSD